ncbi:MAG TPA: hypothetical protein VJ841_00425 [Candidatus Saccharimonadales bacterium]|nr:hypothetical protein [Candidatus Saccharimonadales bacterium]
MINENFVIIGAILNIIGSSSYAWSTLKGTTQPNRISWFLWAVIPMIAFSAQLKEGVGLPALMTFMVGFGPFLIFVASLQNRKAYWKISRLDWWCGGLSILAALLWVITGTGLVAIILSILADFLAGMPTLLKAFSHPESEQPGVFRNGALSALITMLAIQHWTFAASAFSLYIFLVCATLYMLIRFKLGLKLTRLLSPSKI